MMMGNLTAPNIFTRQRAQKSIFDLKTKRKVESMQLIVIVEGGDQVHSLDVPYDSDLLMVMQLIQSEVIYYSVCVVNGCSCKLYPHNLISKYQNLHILLIFIKYVNIFILRRESQWINYTWNSKIR